MAIQRFASLNRSRSGAVAVFFCIFLLVIVTLFCAGVSLGDLVNKKIHTQTCTDLSAVAGASWQCRGMNLITILNLTITASIVFEIVKTCLTGTPPAGFLPSYIEWQQKGQDWTKAAFNQFYVGTVGLLMDGGKNGIVAAPFNSRASKSRGDFAEVLSAGLAMKESGGKVSAGRGIVDWTNLVSPILPLLPLPAYRYDFARSVAKKKDADVEDKQQFDDVSTPSDEEEGDNPARKSPYNGYEDEMKTFKEGGDGVTAGEAKDGFLNMTKTFDLVKIDIWRSPNAYAPDYPTIFDLKGGAYQVYKHGDIAYVGPPSCNEDSRPSRSCADGVVTEITLDKLTGLDLIPEYEDFVRDAAGAMSFAQDYGDLGAMLAAVTQGITNEGSELLNPETYHKELGGSWGTEREILDTSFDEYVVCSKFSPSGASLVSMTLYATPEVKLILERPMAYVALQELRQIVPSPSYRIGAGLGFYGERFWELGGQQFLEPQAITNACSCGQHFDCPICSEKGYNNDETRRRWISTGEDSGYYVTDYRAKCTACGRTGPWRPRPEPPNWSDTHYIAPNDCTAQYAPRVYHYYSLAGKFDMKLRVSISLDWGKIYMAQVLDPENDEILPDTGVEQPGKLEWNSIKTINNVLWRSAGFRDSEDGGGVPRRFACFGYRLPTKPMVGAGLLGDRAYGMQALGSATYACPVMDTAIPLVPNFQSSMAPPSAEDYKDLAAIRESLKIITDAFEN